MDDLNLRSSLRCLGARLRLPLLLAGSVLVATCGGSGGGSTAQAPQLAACTASIDGEGNITMPLVQDGSAFFTYVFAPDPTDPSRFVPTQTPADAGSSSCGAVALPSGTSSPLVAGGIMRQGQTVSVSLQDDGQGAFRKVAATTSGGTLAGFVGGLTPISGGTVKVLDSTQSVLATGSTNAWGSIVLNIDQLPDSFRVVVTGGTMSAAPFVGSLQAEVRNYSTVSDSPEINVTPFTTIISAYLQRYPGLSLSDAMDQVKLQLNIPASLNADSMGQDAGDYFDSTVFYAEAAAAGGVDAQIDAVLSDWEAGTPHTFNPAVEVDRLEPTELMKIALPADELPDFKTGSCGTACASPKVSPLDVAGFAFAIYSGVKTAEFQADVVNKLNQIKAQVDRLNTSVAALSEAISQTDYKTSRATIDKLRDNTLAAWRALHWLATNPASGVMPPSVDACTSRDVSPACRTWLNWVDDVNTRRAAIDKVNLRENDARFNEYEANLVLYQRALAGEGLADKGMLRQYRSIVVGRVSQDSSKRLFFTSTDSNLIWDHYNYWSNMQALTYFMYADFLTGIQRADLLDSTPTQTGLRQQFDNLVIAEVAAMPTRILPKDLYIDYWNAEYHITPTAPNPLLWKINAQGCAIFGIQFDAANVSLQKDMTSFFACMNNRSLPYGEGLTGWRIPTATDMAAFTQVSGKPDRDLGTWLNQRGMDIATASSLNGVLVYTAYTTLCTGNYFIGNSGPRPPCSTYNYYFYYEMFNNVVTWEPFFQMNVLHSFSVKTSVPGTSGRVFPVRSVAAGEYW